MSLAGQHQVLEGNSSLGHFELWFSIVSLI